MSISSHFYGRKVKGLITLVQALFNYFAISRLQSNIRVYYQ